LERIFSNHTGERAFEARNFEERMKQLVIRLRKKRRVDVDELSERARIVHRESHAEETAQRSADRLAAANSERALKFSNPRRERFDRIWRVAGFFGIARTRQIWGDHAIALGEIAHDVAPRIARGHEPVHQKQRLAFALLTIRNVMLSERDRIDLD